jgi:hypothetical protein
MQSRRIKKLFYIMVICYLAVSNAVAQPSNPSSDPDTVPLTGIEILLGAGALLGAKKLLRRNKEEKNFL